MSDIPNLRHLHVVSEVARLGSVSRTAEAIYLSQSATTQAIHKLEQDIGEPLFYRSATGMFPTEFGRVFIERVNRALEHLKAFEKVQAAPNRKVGAPFSRSITTTQLRALVAVVKTGGFSLAADHLGLAQPTVHRAAKDLEKVVGHTLFIRNIKGVDLTYKARRLAQLASLAFAEIQQGFEEIDELNGRIQGQLSIGSLPLARTHLLPASVTRLLEFYPYAKVRIVEGPYHEQLNALLHGQLDCIIGALRFPAPTNEIRQECLFEDPLSIVVRAGHPALAAPQPSAGELAKLQWIAPVQTAPGRRNFDAFFTSQELSPPDQVIECSSLIAIRSLLLASDRAAIISARQAEHEIRAGTLAVLTSALSGTSRPIGLTYRKDWKPTSLQETYLSLVRDVTRQYQG
ncbi:LysR family transcriptional regulator [Marinimicrobium alkaliphilum]|uniref:LysR family transcriptional regulator n=1 Tax=Marinimicrobium alkaliphilum TaxID=2202654 RepID=UPI000DBA795E|nr:LysR family transcriptional regulator [Marinimicrobium alkaliphilum]